MASSDDVVCETEGGGKRERKEGKKREGEGG